MPVCILKVLFNCSVLKEILYMQTPAPKKAAPKRPNESLQKKDSDESDSDSLEESDEEPQKKKAKVVV